MTLDDVLVQTTVEFPRPLKLKELQELFVYVTQSIPGSEIHFRSERSKRIGNRYAELKPDENPPRKVQLRNVQITSADVATCQDTISFSCYKDRPHGTTKAFYGIHFDILPAKRIEEVPAGRHALMHATRSAIGLYFSQHPQPI